MEIDLSKTSRIIEKYRGKKGGLISILQDVQAAHGYVPRESVELISSKLSVYPVEIYGILTFYAQFYLTPPGLHTIKVCQGTACHVMGGEEILDYLSEKLGIKAGETTEDRMFSLQRVACLGCCGMAPVVMIDNSFYGRCTIQKADELIKNYRSGKVVYGY